MTHQEILNKTKAEIDSLCAQAKEKLDAMAPKELEVGKWYKTPQGGLYCLTSSDGRYYSIYGFSVVGDWFGNANVSKSITNRDTEATYREVEKALIKEAKRRGYKDSFIAYNYDQNVLCGDNERLLMHRIGNWNPELEQDKFAELKEAYRKGVKIQFRGVGTMHTWYDCHKNHDFMDDYEYRIKPEEKPKVGDVCKFWNEYDDVFIVGTYAELRDRDDQWDDNNTHIHGVRLGANYYTKFFKHAKTLNQQEAIELLFNNK